MRACSRDAAGGWSVMWRHVSAGSDGWPTQLSVMWRPVSAGSDGWPTQPAASLGWGVCPRQLALYHTIGRGVSVCGAFGGGCEACHRCSTCCKVVFGPPHPQTQTRLDSRRPSCVTSLLRRSPQALPSASHMPLWGSFATAEALHKLG